MFAAALPDLEALDLEAAKALLRVQHAALNSGSGEIERLKLLVAKLQGMLYGVSSEKVLRQLDQLELQLEELEAARTLEQAGPVALNGPRPACQR